MTHSEAGKKGGKASGVNLAALVAALEAERLKRGHSWRYLAREAGVPPSSLTRMVRHGKSLDLHSFAALVTWLGVSADTFIRRGATATKRGARGASRHRG